jgi:outer membrane protein assembly factor BamB
MKIRLPLVLLSAALLTGCAGLDVAKDGWNSLNESLFGKDNAEPPRELAADFQPKSKLNLLWKESIGSGYGKQNINLVPAVNDDSVIAADYEGVIQARNRATGEKRWTVESGLPLLSGPVLSKDKLIFGTRDAEVAAFAINDGALLWKTSVSSAILALPAVARGVVVVRSSDGRITGLDEKTGATLWSHEHAAPALAVRSKGGPAIVEDLVIDGFGGGKLTALKLKNGQQEWESLVALARGRSEVERLLDINATPVLKDSTLYVSGYQGGIAAVSLRNGDVEWRQEKLYTHTGLSGNRRSLFMSDASSDVWRLDMRGGNDLWKQTDLHQRRLTMPIPIKDKLVVGDFQGYLHVLSQDDGSLLARLEIDGTSIEAAPVVYDDVIYVYTSGGKLAALTVE